MKSVTSSGTMHPSGRPGLSIPATLRAITVLAVIAAAAMPGSPALAQQEERGSDLTVGPAAICRDVQEREPVGSASTFSRDVGRLYCFTRVNGATDPTHVTHIWFHEDREVHRMDLRVDSPSWRTWTYKTIPPEWTGSWRVDVQDADGVIIYSIPFTVSEGAGSGGDEAAPDRPPGD